MHFCIFSVYRHLVIYTIYAIRAIISDRINF